MISSVVDDHIGSIEIQREDRRNALDIEHCIALGDAARDLIARGARCLILSGRGSAFCAGADFEVVADPAFRRELYRSIDTLTQAEVPVIASVQGPAIGAGLQLAIAGDLRVVGPDACFAIPSARLGLAVNAWTVRRLVEIVGSGPASRLLLASETWSLGTADRHGLVDHHGDHNSATVLAQNISTSAPLTLSYSKMALRSAELGYSQSLLEVHFERCWASADLAEGLLARTERRSPSFQGR
jgi:enoyl-CoA hydratase